MVSKKKAILIGVVSALILMCCACCVILLLMPIPGNHYHFRPANPPRYRTIAGSICPSVSS